jgi:hypothetical protein
MSTTPENVPGANAADALDSGIAQADAQGAEDTKAKLQEEADVKCWTQRIDTARKFDKEARKEYARCRRYARGDSGFEVDANLIGTYIDITESFLYARNPDVDVRPAPTASVPSDDAIQDAAEASAKVPPEAMQAIEAEAIAAIKAGTPIEQAVGSARAAQAFAQRMAVSKQADAIRDAYNKRRADHKAVAETLEIVISRLWHDANMKRHGRKWVRSALTTAVGILKCTWQERTAPSPETKQRIQDLQGAIQRAAALRQELNEDQGADQDATIAEYQRQLESLQAQVEQIVARGFVIEIVEPENLDVPPGYDLGDYLDAPWLAERIPMLLEDAKAEFELSEEDCRAATRYAPKPIETVKRESASIDEKIDAADADRFASADGAALQNNNSIEWNSENGGAWVICREIWDASSNSVLTMINGIKHWVKPCWYPKPTTRFYPYFLLLLNEVDGQRHPQSLVTRSMKLVDEYNRIGSAEAEHRRRSLPGILYHAGMVDSETMNNIVRSTTGEYTGIKTTQMVKDVRGLFVPKPYAPVDIALYDRTRIINELERLWGVQEALAGAVAVKKTATEAQIQNGGFQARTGGRSDLVETVLTECALYTAEVAHAHMDADDARAIAGPNAMWPEYQGPQDLAAMVVVYIRAGSSGKPDTAAEAQSWATQLPILKELVVTVGQLRQSSPLDIADSLEKLAQVTAERSGDRIDIDQLMPKAGQPIIPAAPAPGAPPPPGASPAPSANDGTPPPPHKPNGAAPHPAPVSSPPPQAQAA